MTVFHVTVPIKSASGYQTYQVEADGADDALTEVREGGGDYLDSESGIEVTSLDWDNANACPAIYVDPDIATQHHESRRPSRRPWSGRSNSDHWDFANWLTESTGFDFFNTLPAECTHALYELFCAAYEGRQPAAAGSETGGKP